MKRPLFCVGVLLSALLAWSTISNATAEPPALVHGRPQAESCSTPGPAIRSTTEHPYWVVGRGWVAAEDLQHGDRLLTSDDKEQVVQSVEVREEGAQHYNFEVADFHTYFVSEAECAPAVWVHNTCWTLGDPIDKALPDGSYPIWKVIRQRYWKTRAHLDPHSFGPASLGLMRRGLAPKVRVRVRNRSNGKIETRLVSKELHHHRGNRGTPGYDSPADLREVWPWEHAGLDSQRRLDYVFLGFESKR
jgi:hypothetical protein